MASSASSKVVPELGLVCMTLSERCRFRTITRSRFLSLSELEQEKSLEELYWANLHRTDAALTFCDQNHIRLYRMSSSLFPMSDYPLGEKVLRRFSTLLSGIGRRAERLGIRVIIHPDQFVVLSSESRQVVRTSIKIMCKHALTLDLMGLPRSAWATMILHGGKAGRGDFLVKMIPKLPIEIRSRLSLENDEHAYGAEEILDVCQRAGVPMIFDNLHHVVREKLPSHDHPSIARFVKLAAATWPDPSWQVVHLSNGHEGLHDERHSHLIEHFPKAFRKVPFVEIEAKGKEDAIAGVRETFFTSKKSVPKALPEA
ncbi:MAG TPA: UV DNA damage repair endonuclease UvsE [Tepidisphaeraceae bacterium]|jgi:UV DNA damage endonuclease